MVFAITLLTALAWIVALAVASLPLLTPPDRRPTLAELAVSAVIGTCGLGVLWVLGRVVSPFAITVPAIASACLMLAGRTIWRRGRLVLPSAPSRTWSAGLIALLLLVRIAPVAVGAALMGAGDFPSAFFHVDTPFRLTHVFELQGPGPFPPSSLLNAGTVAGNHFGAPAATAALATLSGLRPHTTLFWIVLPIGAVGAFCAALLMVEHMTPPGPLRPALLLLILSAWPWPTADTIETLRSVATNHDLEPLRSAVIEAWEDPQTFRNHFEDVTEVLGRVLLLVSALPLFVGQSFVAGAVALVFLGQVKTGHALLGAIMLGAACGAEAVRRGSARPLVLATAATGTTAALMRLGAVLPSLGIVFEPLWLTRHFPELLETYGLALVVFGLLPVGLILVGARRGYAAHAYRMTPLLVALVGVYGFFELFGAYRIRLDYVPGSVLEIRPMEELAQPLQHMPALFAMAAAAGVAVVWPWARPASRWAVLTFIAILALPPTVHRAYGAVLMATAPAQAHEYADNRSIAAALETIPVAGSIVATNDLRYPANGSWRDLRQFQIPAVWGHQAFGVPGYDRYQGWERRVLLQWALRTTSPSCMALQDLAAAGVTHILIHKTVEHPASLPLPKTHESAGYAVYVLRGAMLSCGRR